MRKMFFITYSILVMTGGTVFVFNLLELAVSLKSRLKSLKPLEIHRNSILIMMNTKMQTMINKAFNIRYA